MNSDLFSFNSEQVLKKHAPLADRLRPRDLDEFVGQEEILGHGRLLRRAIDSDRVGNLILHGPPGVGKTTLARIIASKTRSHFSVINAVLAGVKDLRHEIDAANERLKLYSLRSILFIDEVHRLNTAQQDALLPWVENGTLTLIGATTENPFFEVNKALISRSRIFRLQLLLKKDLQKLLKRALKDKERGYGNKKIIIKGQSIEHLIDVANGDARSLLNALELAIESSTPDECGVINIDRQTAEESIQERFVLYDKNGDCHYDTISAFIKSLRGSDPDAALFWLARMLEAGESPRFIFRRMLIFAGEDVGLADPQAIVVVDSCASAFERIGLPEGVYSLSQAALYLASTVKSNSLCGFFAAQKMVRDSQHQNVPTHLRDAHRDGALLGDGKDYLYPHLFDNHWVPQQYLPSEIRGETFWKPTSQGWEGKQRKIIFERRAIQLAMEKESEMINPLFLSVAPANPSVESWLRRQLEDGSHTDKLQRLINSLWVDVQWNRTDRVLVLVGNSLLWALDPLKGVPEGGVTIASDQSFHKALTAELNLIDALHRPLLIDKLPQEIRQLSCSHFFEWIGGRLYSDDLQIDKIDELWTEITQKSALNAHLRVLITKSISGPASSLKKLIDEKSIKKHDPSFLEEIITIEDEWIHTHSNEVYFIDKLKELGWLLEIQQWEEKSSIIFDKSIESRWLGKDSMYRNLLDSKIDQKSIDKLLNIFREYQDQPLKHSLIYYKLSGSLEGK